MWYWKMRLDPKKYNGIMIIKIYVHKYNNKFIIYIYEL